ncbi:sensor domain-containing diguanylate cyclase [Paraglaciecola arctica]|uniref:sensor domain-containing diguanylate cyclase n=1 Tax=Paraglaciecola arctica TaxID=1128911 RepID=UPI001C078919|nr:sensor domain-containing diguanylate cyclase [Paraglaciecola arctica]MBU3002405.1 sensor domain-containing diguanylate cyclase [Paraglaciecola arctica]
MPFWKKYLNPKFYLVLLIIVFSVALSAIVSLSKSVEDQSLLELKSLTPAFDIVSHEVLKPLFIAETVARASSLKSHMNDEVIDSKKMIALLNELSKEFEMNFFVASETSLTQYFSDGSTLPLNSETVEWYFRAKQSSLNIVAGLGNREDIHIYFDIKIHNEQGEFLGFIGVSKRLNRIISSFENIKNTYDYDFIFVDDNDDIVLSSDKSLLADGKRIKNLQQLPWFQAFTPKQRSGQQSNDNILVDVEGNDFLVTKVELKALNWKLFLVNSLQVRQSETIKLFLIQTVNFMFVLLLGLLIARIGIPYIQAEFASKYQIDPLTQLPNRAHLEWRFKQFKKDKQSLGAIIVDIDHFKMINDTYGHAVGDLILCEFAELLKSQLREVDVIARWGGEEFVILLPSTEFHTAYEVAERARVVISNHNFTVGDKKLSMSASFGVAFRARAYKLVDIVTHADHALYLAKREGRNTVRTTNDLKSNAPLKVSNVRVT